MVEAEPGVVVAAAVGLVVVVLRTAVHPCDLASRFSLDYGLHLLGFLPKTVLFT